MRNTDNGDPKSMRLLGCGALTLRAALLGAAVCVALAAHVAPALAGDDDDDDEPSIEQKIIRGIMHGIADGTEKGIAASSPLVPPKLTPAARGQRQRSAEAELAEGSGRRGASRRAGGQKPHR